MGRLRAWHNLPPVLQSCRYRRLLEQHSSSSTTANSGSSPESSEGAMDWIDAAATADLKLDESSSGNVASAAGKKKKSGKLRRRMLLQSATGSANNNTSGGGKANRKKDNSRQLIQESFQELMSYSCGQCGHVQTLQAEELKSILGHAFRLAYAAHLQKAAGIHDYPGVSPLPPPSPPPTSSRLQQSPCSPILHSSTSTSSSPKAAIITGYSSSSSTSCSSGDKTRLLHHCGHNTNCTPGCTGSSENTSSSNNTTTNNNTTTTNNNNTNNNHNNSSSSSSQQYKQQRQQRVTGRMRTPAALPGLQTTSSPLHHQSCRLSPDSDTSNSPTDHNSCHRLLDKPPLLKQLTVPPLEVAPSPPTQTSPTHHLVDPCLNNNNTNNLNSGGAVIGGYVNDANRDKNNASSSQRCCSNLLSHNITVDEVDSCSSEQQSLSRHSLTHSPFHSSSNSHSQSPRHHSSSNSLLQSPLHTVNNISHSQQHHQSPLHSSHHSPHHSTVSSCVSSVSTPSPGPPPTPPPLPERSDSLAAPDEPHLRAAAWFQAGIPREIALEVLGQEPQGAFLVRESSSKPGCYALSLRVPTDFAAAGIAHYLIVRTHRGYRIKGFTKEFPTLRTLITHHSVMPELLPVPLLLTRHNPAFEQHGDTKDQNEEDPDYNTLSDFRKMMADLNV